MSQTIIFDTKLDIELYPHQIVNIENMELLEKKENITIKNGYYTLNMKNEIGILGDIAGYGKSYSIVSLIARDKMEWKAGEKKQIVEENFSTRTTTIITTSEVQTVSETLLLCSPSIVYQWQEYFEHSNLRVCVILNAKNITSFEFGVYDVVIVVPTMYCSFMFECNSDIPKMWKRFVFDEPVHVHIPRTTKTAPRAGFTWFVTASYTELISNGSRNRNRLDKMICPTFFYGDVDILKYILVKNSDEFVRSSYSSYKQPDIIHTTHECRNRVLNVISNHVDSDIRAIVQAGNMKLAIELLGGEGQENIYQTIKNRLEFRKEEAEGKVRLYTRQGNDSYAKVWKEKLVKIDKEIEDIHTKYTDMMKDDCAICMSEKQEPILVPCCQNIFCGRCISTIIATKPACPFCRAQIESKSLVKVTLSDKKTETKREGPKEVKNKNDTIIDMIVTSGKDRKFIIYSAHDNSFDIIRCFLREKKIGNIDMSGAAPQRKKKLEKFRTDDNVKVLFLNSDVNAAGLNIQFSTDIILYHYMSQDTVLQIVGRVDRIGRNHDLFVHHFSE